jgi:cytochrome c biogenesis protein CcdA
VIDGPFAIAFVSGLIAVVNPCGFAMLPAYLSSFLGIETRAASAGADASSGRASLTRAVVVSLCVSAGFLTVFTVLGAILRAGGAWVADLTLHLTAVIGVALVALGVAMLFGFRLRLAVPRLERGGRDGTVVSMYVFGISYAIASLGCTISPFVATVLGSFTRDGALTGVLTIAAYGAGMALLLTALTVSLALAEDRLLHGLRGALRYVDIVAAVLLIVAGLYLVYYWWYDVASDTGAEDVRGQGLVVWLQDRMTDLQAWLLERSITWLVVVFGGVILVGVLVLYGARRPARARSPAGTATRER